MSMIFRVLLLALVGAHCVLVQGSNITSHRSGKALSLFNIIRFANSPCAGAGIRNGTCYTEVECKEKNGVSAGTCASGYGVCCTLYVDANDDCNELAFQLGATSSVNRQWSIKITQYACDYDNLAPEGCTQYHFGRNTGLLKTFNFDGGVHLANQEQKICVRQERGNCQTCYIAATDTDFLISGKTTSAKGFITKTQCCGYGSDGMGTKGYDCVVIPGALKLTDKVEPAIGSQFCGRKLTTINSMTKNQTICTKQRPFHITFRSDNFEHKDESKAKVDPGFRLVYAQKSC